MSLLRRVRDLARRAYTGHLRAPLAAGVVGGFRPTLTRQALLDGRVPTTVEVRVVDDPETVRLAPPAHVAPVPDALREKVGEWTLDPPFVATVRDAQLVGPNALALTADGAYLPEAVDGSSPRVADELIRCLAAQRLPVRRGAVDRRLDAAVPLAGPWSREFFHWFADYLPRLRTLERWTAVTGEAPPLLVPADSPAWLTASLDLLGVPADRRVSWTDGRVAVDRLVVPSLPRHVGSTAPPAGYVHSPRALSWVADHLRDAVGSDDRRPVGDRLYVSREGQPARAVVNEAALCPILREHGFAVVRPEEWSLAEQVATFAAAEAVCGPHGAGLLNTVYGPEAALLELFGARTNPCFYAITAGLGRQYAAHRATAEEDNLRVGPDRLANLLGLLDSQSRSSADAK